MEHSDLFEKLLHILKDLDYIKASQLPDIDLYMDQVTSFMDAHLESSKRYPDDKILTKTMINNYTKNDLLPPSVKKKYSQEHLVMLIFIYYMKNIMSISDIKTLLDPLNENYFYAEGNLTLKQIYRDVIRLETRMFRPFYRDISRKVELAEDAFEDAPEEDREYLQNFAMVCMLAFDVYLKKQMIETIVDDMRGKEETAENEEKKEKKEKREKE